MKRYKINHMTDHTCQKVTFSVTGQLTIDDGKPEDSVEKLGIYLGDDNLINHLRETLVVECEAALIQSYMDHRETEDDYCDEGRDAI